MGHFKFLHLVCAYNSFMSQVIVVGGTALGQFGNKLAATVRSGSKETHHSTLNSSRLLENRVCVGLKEQP